MKAFFKRHRKLHIWILVDLGLLVAFWLTRGPRVWMNALADQATNPLRAALGRLCARTEISVMEVLYAAAAVAALGYLVWNVAAVIRARGRRGRRTYVAVLGAVCGLVTVYLGFCLLWGVNYYTDSFQDRSGIRAQPVAVEDLTAVTAYFVDRLQETAGQVPRDEEGHFDVSPEEILSRYARVYDAVEEQFPFLDFPETPPKAMAFSKLMSAMNFTGVYCPFTGETNLNVDAPACMLPATVAHELAHQRAVASEQECNFLAVLASTTCGDVVYAYSGWLMGYIHLGNALYRADPEAWATLRVRLPEEALTDLGDNSAYWDQYTGAAATAGQGAYDMFLKGYGEEDGIRSYGTVVDLLVAYYGAAQ